MIPNNNITDIFTSKYFVICENNFGVCRYFGRHGDIRFFTILDSVFEFKYICRIRNCTVEMFSAFTSSNNGEKLGLEFLKIQLELSLKLRYENLNI